MARQHLSRMMRRSWNGYFALLIFVFFNPLFFVGTSAQAAYRTGGSGDLLSDVPVVDERTLNSAACGIAAATMVLDYYLPQSGSIHQAIAISTVSHYVKQFYGYNAQGQSSPAGTTFRQLQAGIEAASVAPEIHTGVSLKAAWHTTDNVHWFALLQSELDAKRPIILFLANGHALGWNWNYGHFIVVSGYTSDESIIYHDPREGQSHTLSKDDFAIVWGTQWNGNDGWQYMTITTAPRPIDFTPFASTWYAHAQQLVIQPDGKAIYTGRVFVWCVDEQGNIINQPPCDGGGDQGISPNQHALLTFTDVSGNTASGTITPGGTGMRDMNASGAIIPIGSTVTVTLHPENDTLSVSNGMLLCGPQAIQNNVDPGCNSGA